MTEAEQRELTRRARLGEERRRRAAWSSARGQILGAVASFEPLAGPQLANGLRGLRRAVDRLDAEVRL